MKIHNDHVTIFKAYYTYFVKLARANKVTYIVVTITYYNTVY